MIPKLSLSILVAIAMVSAAVPGTADQSAADPVVTLTINENGFATQDVDGTPVQRVLLTVTNPDATAAIILIRVDFPADAPAAAFQDAPPPGWAMDVQGHADGRDYVVYTGLLAPEQTARFNLRVTDLDASEPFRVSFDTPSPLGMLPPAPVDGLTAAAASGSVSTVLMPLCEAGDVALYVPACAVTDVTSAAVLMLAYDRDHRVYLGADAAPAACAVDAPLGDDATFPVDGAHRLGLVDSPAGPLLTPAGGAPIDVARVALWTGLDANAGWFVQNPGRYIVTCDGALPFAVVPPGDDSDLDGFVNINEIRSNANPVSGVSTPYTDDDGDGILNGRDPVTTWQM